MVDCHVEPEMLAFRTMITVVLLVHDLQRHW